MVFQNEGMKKVVDAAMEWWADPNDSTKTIVTLSDVCDAYSKVYCRGCGIVRENCPKMVLGLSALACCQDCSHKQQVIEKRFHVCHDCGYKGDQAEHNEFTGCTSIAKVE